MRLAIERTGTVHPTWEIAHLFPAQGTWSEEEYLALPGNRLVELSEGKLEVLPMPTTSHQALLLYLYGVINAFAVGGDLGKVLIAPLRVRLWPERFREPDLVFMLKRHFSRIGEEFWLAAGLVMEVVSHDPDGRRRDLMTKRREYARARIPEYWIVDPQTETITVLRLTAQRYAVHGLFAKREQATSHLLASLAVDVTAAFAEARAVVRKGRRAGQSGRKRGSIR
jgi:Uma2 family endonuclease